MPSSTESTCNSWAAWEGSAGFLRYFKTELVGRTAKFWSDAKRVMMASVMPMPHASSPEVPERDRNGRTAMVRSDAERAAIDVGDAEVAAGFGALTEWDRVYQK
ncbi:MAG: hypothetical protein DMG71_16840 [Acidobacteria bacterium]|nr:MAG: hypothetical protein DMG71_16840 [Acidobacteriota bacterium]